METQSHSSARHRRGDSYRALRHDPAFSEQYSAAAGHLASAGSSSSLAYTTCVDSAAAEAVEGTEAIPDGEDEALRSGFHRERAEHCLRKPFESYSMTDEAQGSGMRRAVRGGRSMEMDAERSASHSISSGSSSRLFTSGPSHNEHRSIAKRSYDESHSLLGSDCVSSTRRGSARDSGSALVETSAEGSSSSTRSVWEAFALQTAYPSGDLYLPHHSQSKRLRAAPHSPQEDETSMTDTVRIQSDNEAEPDEAEIPQSTTQLIRQWYASADETGGPGMAEFQDVSMDVRHQVGRTEANRDRNSSVTDRNANASLPAHEFDATTRHQLPLPTQYGGRPADLRRPPRDRVPPPRLPPRSATMHRSLPQRPVATLRVPEAAEEEDTLQDIESIISSYMAPPLSSIMLERQLASEQDAHSSTHSSHVAYSREARLTDRLASLRARANHEIRNGRDGLGSGVVPLIPRHAGSPTFPPSDFAASTDEPSALSHRLQLHSTATSDPFSPQCPEARDGREINNTPAGESIDTQSGARTDGRVQDQVISVYRSMQFPDPEASVDAMAGDPPRLPSLRSRSPLSLPFGEEDNLLESATTHRQTSNAGNASRATRHEPQYSLRPLTLLTTRASQGASSQRDQQSDRGAPSAMEIARAGESHARHEPRLGARQRIHAYRLPMVTGRADTSIDSTIPLRSTSSSGARISRAFAAEHLSRARDQSSRSTALSPNYIAERHMWDPSPLIGEQYSHFLLQRSARRDSHQEGMASEQRFHRTGLPTPQGADADRLRSWHTRPFLSSSSTISSRGGRPTLLDADASFSENNLFTGLDRLRHDIAMDALNAERRDEVERERSFPPLTEATSTARPSSSWERYGIGSASSAAGNTAASASSSRRLSVSQYRLAASTSRFGVSFSSGDYLSNEEFELRNTYEGLWQLSSQLGDVWCKAVPADIVACLPTYRYDDWLEEQLSKLEHTKCCKPSISEGVQGKGKAREWSSRRCQSAALLAKEQDEEKSCAICLELYLDSDIVMKLPCKHFYHQDCIKAWLSSARTCPYCRGDVVASQKEQPLVSVL